jgi:methionyl-tRNA formyltransferase
MSFRVVIVSRYPNVDTPSWKSELAGRLRDWGADLVIVYSRATLRDQAEAGLHEFGTGVLREYLRSRRDSNGFAAPRTLVDWAKENGVPIHRFRSLREPEVVNRVRALRADVLVLAGADLLPAPLSASARLGALNAHYGLLPRYRGMNVAEWSVFHDDPVGVSVHKVDAGIDTGDIVERAIVGVDERDSLAGIRRKQQDLASTLLFKAVTDLADGTAEAWPQPHAEGRQFYRMHPLLRRSVEWKLRSGAYRWAGLAPSLDELVGSTTTAPRARA